MKLLTMAALLALPLMAETWTDVPIVDVACSAKVKSNPDAHTRDCAMKCEKSGYAIITPDGNVLKLDEKGNQEALAALKASKKTDHLHATVTGDREGETIKVKSLKM
ncbi:MAG: hypothetical protein LAO79_23555 [Acidobacteriia bacterium]|nr:hypothetical protein [Terriglobia bacterium]